MTTSLDGYGNMITRDTTGVSGGLSGHVNTAFTSYTITGRDVKTFEWNALFLLNNFAKEGENCAMYAQANKHAEGPTWAACFEACDTSPGDATGLVAAEFDTWVTGEDNGLRINADIVVGDSTFIRHGKRSDKAVSTYAIRASACGATPWAKWAFGMHLQDFLYAGIHLQANSIRGIHLEGEYIVALDLAQTKGQTSIRLPEGGRVTFDPYDQVAMSRNGNRLDITNGGVAIISFDLSTGDIYKRGVKVL